MRVNVSLFMSVYIQQPADITGTITRRVGSEIVQVLLLLGTSLSGSDLVFAMCDVIFCIAEKKQEAA